jgi:hypothetical protein
MKHRTSYGQLRARSDLSHTIDYVCLSKGIGASWREFLDHQCEGSGSATERTMVEA